MPSDLADAGSAEAEATAPHDSPRNRDKLMMLAATVARMAVGLMTFIVLARYLGPQPFGVIATAMAYSGFAGLISDFGFSTSALRKAAADTEQAGAIVGEALAAKTVLLAAITLVGAAIAILVLPRAWLPIYATVYVGTIAATYAEFLLLIARARRRFDVEAKLVIMGSVMMLLILGGITAVTRDVQLAAIAFAVTRLLYLLLVTALVGRWVGRISNIPRDLATIWTAIRGSMGYAVDNILTNLSGQIDVLLFGALLTAHDMGIYQAGARLVQVIMPFASVLATAYMPALSAAAINGHDDSFRRNGLRLNLEFTGLAVIGGLGFAFAGPLVTKLIYGSSYDMLLPLWSGFGAFAVLRFAAAAFGIQLAALGHIRTRIAAQIASIIVFAGATALILPKTGIIASSWLLALSALPALLILGIALVCDRRSGKSPAWSIAISITAVLGLLLI